ncbi:MAG: hypothetical protein JKX76_03675 [Colwellia sp.]|nr:hypothetical protein [Colwellia sp.]
MIKLIKQTSMSLLLALTCITSHADDRQFTDKIINISSEDSRFANRVNNISFRVLNCDVKKLGCYRLKNVYLKNITSTFTTENYIYVGTNTGAIWRCPQSTTEECEHWDKASSSIASLFVYGGYLYVGTAKRLMLKCPEGQKNSCKRHNRAGSSINTMFIVDDSIFAGTGGGTLWKCPTKTKESCVDLNKAGSSINTLFVEGNSIYAGTNGGTMWKCPTDKKDSCVDLNTFGSAVTAIFVHNQKVFAGTENGSMLYCDTVEKSTCKTIYSAGNAIIDIYVDDDSFSALVDGKRAQEVVRCTNSDAWKCLIQTNVQWGFTDENAYNECPIKRLHSDSPLALSNLDVSKLDYKNWKGKIKSELTGACKKGTEILYVVALKDNKPHIYFLEICVGSRNIPESENWRRYTYINMESGDNCYRKKGKLRFVHSLFVGDYTGSTTRRLRPNFHSVEGLVMGAGMVEIENEKIIMINNCSGHYKPNSNLLNQAVEIMKENSKIPVSKNVKIEQCE